MDIFYDRNILLHNSDVTEHFIFLLDENKYMSFKNVNSII